MDLWFLPLKVLEINHCSPGAKAIENSQMGRAHRIRRT